MKLLTGLVFSGWRGVSSHSFSFPSSSPPLLFFFLPALTLLYTFSLQLFQTNFRSSWAPCLLLLSCCCTGCVLCLNHLLPFLHLAMIYQYLNLSLHIMYEVFPNFHHLACCVMIVFNLFFFPTRLSVLFCVTTLYYQLPANSWTMVGAQ